MAVELLPNMLTSSGDIPASSGGASVSEDSLHPSVVSDLFDGDLCADELNEIPDLPGMENFAPMMASAVGSLPMLDDHHHPAAQIAMTACAIDGALSGFEFLEPTAAEAAEAAAASGMISDVSDDSDHSVNSQNVNNKRASTKKSSQPTKKRRTKTGVAPPTLVTPTSSISGVDAFKPAPASVTMPVLPDNINSAKPAVAPLLPRPTADGDSTEPTKAIEEKAPASPSSKRAPLKVDPLGPVNISKEYIEMLTSESGAAECAKAIACSFAPVSPGGRSSKRQMTAAERAQASRDRNREHARNTRLRKKAYVEELKRTLNALAEQRDEQQLHEQQNEKMKEEQRKVRFLVLEELLRLNGVNSQQVGRWSAILMPSFSLSAPTISLHDDTVEQKTHVGVHQVMDNARNLSSFLQTLAGSSDGVTMRFETDRSCLLMDGSQACLDFRATTVGAKQELSFQGTIKALFDPESNRVLSATMLFDSGILLAHKKKMTYNY